MCLPFSDPHTLVLFQIPLQEVLVSQEFLLGHRHPPVWLLCETVAHISVSLLEWGCPFDSLNLRQQGRKKI